MGLCVQHRGVETYSSAAVLQKDVDVVFVLEVVVELDDVFVV